MIGQSFAPFGVLMAYTSTHGVLMRLKLSLMAILIAGAAFAQPAAPQDDIDEEGQGDESPSMQCVIESPQPDVGPITCDTPPGPPGLPCYCPDGGPAAGHRVPSGF